MNMLDIIRRGNELSAQTARNEIRACNELSQKYGLVLRDEEIVMLVEKREESLRANGRVEFGEGIMPKLIYAFCDSPYIGQVDYAQTLADLQDTFYYYKSGMMEIMPDDELIALMVELFNGPAHGSIEQLKDKEMAELCEQVKNGCDYLRIIDDLRYMREHDML